MTPDTGPHQLAAVTPTGRGPAADPAPALSAPSVKLRKSTAAQRAGRSPSPALIIV